MDAVYHEAVCRYQINDIVMVNGLDQAFKIEEIMLMQYVKANTMQFFFQVRNTANGELMEGWIPYNNMGEIIRYGNGETPKGSS